MTTKTKLTGRAAYQFALEMGVSLHKYADPMSDACTYDMTVHAEVYEAKLVLADDPSLLWVEVTL